MMHAVQKVNGSILWANLHLLFWLSLIPAVTAWMGENSFAPWPVALYGIVLLCAAVAYYILTKVLIKYHGQASPLATAVRKDVKGKASVAIYAVAIPFSFYNPWIAFGLYTVVALMWLIPDRRIEKVLSNP